MSIVFRPYEDLDYSDVCRWWKQYPGWEQGVPERFLSDNGFVAELYGEPVGAVWVYLSSNSSIAWSEWLVCDPSLDARQKVVATSGLIDSATEYSLEQGCEFIFTSTKHTGLIRTFQKKGYSKTDEGMTNLVYINNPQGV